MTSSWQAEVESDCFNEFINVVWAQLRELTDSLPSAPVDGICEVFEDGCSMGYAIESSIKFAAFRGVMPGAAQFDAFFVSPSSSKPRAGIVVRAFKGSNPASLPDWWTTQLALPVVPAEGVIPSFLELATLLAANGSVTTTNAALQSQVSDLQHENTYYKQLATELAEESRQANAKVRDLIAARDEAKLSKLDLHKPDTAAAPITDLTGLPAWAEANSNRIIVMPRALGGAKKSLYENPAAVFDALEFLAGPYRQARMGQLGKAELDAALNGVGCQIRGSAGQATLGGAYGDSYAISWNGRRRILDMHLIKGGGRDARYCLRVYFFWDEDTKKVIVGWLPTHLDNSLT